MNPHFGTFFLVGRYPLHQSRGTLLFSFSQMENKSGVSVKMTLIDGTDGKISAGHMSKSL